MSQVPAHIFREYDIRGIADCELTDENVYLIGHAYGSWLAARGVTAASLGGDARLSTPRIKAAAARGLCAAGIDVTDIGMVSTPTFYWSLYRLPVGGGIMVTAATTRRSSTASSSPSTRRRYGAKIYRKSSKSRGR